MISQRECLQIIYTNMVAIRSATDTVLLMLRQMEPAQEGNDVEAGEQMKKIQESSDRIVRTFGSVPGYTSPDPKNDAKGRAD